MTLFFIADKDLIFIVLSFIGLILFGVVIFYVVKKNRKVMPISEDDRYDAVDEKKELTEEQKQAKAELERVYNMMSADLENEKSASAIDEFEREQEENAIISYRELIKQAKEKGQISEEFEEEYKTDFEEEKEEKKFKNSEIISPVFGVKGSNTYPKNDNEKFLDSLKEFRENL